jgi:hypothetical protein
MRKSHFNDEFLVLLGPIISWFFAGSNEKKTKGACSSPISMTRTLLNFNVIFCAESLFVRIFSKFQNFEGEGGILREPFRKIRKSINSK